jgi:Uma2 family endonuclease
MTPHAILPNVIEPKNLGRRATYQDVLDAPEHLVAEIVDGELYTSPRPAGRHTVASARLHKVVVPFDGEHGRGGPGGWWIVFEPELHFGEDVVVPDLVGWRRERMPEYPEAPYITLAPDWLCEVLSPSTAKFDRHKKLRVYAREGVRHCWLVDPIATTVEVLVLDGANWVTEAIHEGGEMVRAAPFDAIEINLADLWIPRATSDATAARGGDGK